MSYVIILHSLGHGGVLASVAEGSTQFKAAWFLEIWAYGAVDIFALTSGYVVNIKKDTKSFLNSYFVLWLEVVFYSLVCVCSLKAMSFDISKKDFIEAVFPVFNNNYWYFTALTGLYIIMPAILKFTVNSSRTALKNAFVIVFLFFSVLDVFIKRFIPGSGYSFVWLSFLFFLGIVIKECQIGQMIKTGYIIIAIPMLTIITWYWRVYGTSLNIMKLSIDPGLLVSYVSPTVLGGAILYIILFSRLKVNKTWEKVIAFLSSGAFAAYLLNDNPLVRQYVITNRFVHLATKPSGSLALLIIIFAGCFLLGAVLIDKIRQILFRVLRVKERTGEAVRIISGKLIAKDE